MSRKNPKPPAHRPGAAILRLSEGETIHIGDAIEVHAVKADRGHTVLSIAAPRTLSIDRAKHFHPTQNSDGPSAPTPEPSAKNPVIQQD